MKRLLLLLMIPVVAHAECVLQDRTVSASTARIEERSGIKQNVVRLPTGESRCIVNFQARIGTEWYMASGHYDWPGDRPAGEACAVAATRAEDSVLSSAVPKNVRSEKVMICNDQPDNRILREAQIGTQGELHQFRSHPSYPDRFWHNGAQCRWFLDSGWNGRDVQTMQGVICQLSNQKWVVVDKF
jgi:hypothetical protein